LWRVGQNIQLRFKKKKQFRELTGRKTTLTTQLGFNL